LEQPWASSVVSAANTYMHGILLEITCDNEHFFSNVQLTWKSLLISTSDNLIRKKSTASGGNLTKNLKNGIRNGLPIYVYKNTITMSLSAVVSKSRDLPGIGWPLQVTGCTENPTK